jgi:hypothetical protein
MPGLHEKIDIIKIINDGEGVEALEQKDARFEFAQRHGGVCFQ